MSLSVMWRIVLAAVVVVALLSPPAHAESVTVAGQGIVKKMVANNTQSQVVAKVYAPGGKCEIREIELELTAKRGTHYRASGTCASGKWRQALYPKDSGMPVKCADLKLTYNATKKFWKFVVPRPCLSGLPNKVRLKTYVWGAGANWGEAGPTKLLARG